MRVCIVGGAGFIGHNLALWLADEGTEVLIADNLMVNNLYALDHDSPQRKIIFQRMKHLQDYEIPLMPVDARDYHTLSRAISPFRPDVIIHLAAVAHLDRTQKDPSNTFDHSLRTLENTLDIAHAIRAKVIYFSSSTVYGDFSKDIIDETEQLKPRSIYGSLKVAGEFLCNATSEAFGLPVVIIRPIALYGPRCISGRVTQVFVERARANMPLHVHGNPAQDFTHISDLCRAISMVLPFEKSETYNVASEQRTTLLELADIVKSRYNVPIRTVDADPLKPKRGAVSCAKIRRDFGYEPTMKIQEGMDLYMSWYEETA